MWESVKSSSDGIAVTILTGGFTLYGFVEKATPILAFIGLIISITVGVLTAINIYRKNKILKKVDKG